jgi:hypothetical protein
MGHESVSVRQEKVGDVFRLRLEHREDKRKRNFFFADFDPKERVLRTMWDSRKSPGDFKIIAEREWLGGIDWEQEEGCLIGKVGKAASVWLDPKLVAAGVQLNLSGSNNVVEDSLEKITKTASQTIIDGISLPEGHHARLTKLISSLPKQSKSPKIISLVRSMDVQVVPSA